MATTQKPYRIYQEGRRTVSVSTYRMAQRVVVGRLASDAEGRVVFITGPNGKTTCRNNGLTIRYSGAQA